MSKDSAVKTAMHYCSAMKHGWSDEGGHLQANALYVALKCMVDFRLMDDSSG